MSEQRYPDYCFGILPTTKEVIMIYAYKSGYTPATEGNQPWYGQETADMLNERHDVTKAQANAMHIGSIIGWDSPGADPDNYDDNGRYIIKGG